jgi:Zn-dependent peptidase ImmA (M78 family)
MGIITPEDIELRTITYKLGIHLSYSERRCFAREDGNFKLIHLNQFLSVEAQREIFFHELCHILRHVGFQYNLMPNAFRELQEWDANHFTRYAAIPFHMLGYCDWKSPTLVSDMSKMFKVSEELCNYRVEHIYRNFKSVNA